MRPFSYAWILPIMICGCTVITSQPLTKETTEAVAFYVLPKAVIEVALWEDNGQYAIQHLATELVPDTNHAYTIAYNPSVFASDDVQISVVTKGYLDKVSVTTDVVVDDVIIDLAKGLASLVPKATQPSGKRVGTYKLDPTNPTDLKAVNRSLSANNLSLVVDLPSAPAKEHTKCNGIAYRPLAPLALKLMTKYDEADSISILLPNGAPVVCLPVSRSGFVERIGSIEFQDGLIKAIALKKPSEALAFVSIPIEVGKAIFSIPAELVQIRINSENSKKDIYDAQKSRIEAKKALEDIKNPPSDNPLPGN